MFDINSRQYIFKLSTGQAANIYYKFGSGLCIRTLGNTNNWSEASVLLNESVSDFSACIDGTDTIHILSCSKDNGLVYTSLKDDVPKNMALNSEQLCRFPSITCISSKIFICYVLIESGKKRLLYQASEGPGQFSAAKAIDLVKGARRPPFHLFIRSNKLYVIYNLFEGLSSKVALRSYDEGNSCWSSPDIVTESRGNTENRIVSAIADINGNIHICWQKSSAAKCDLVYSRRFPNSETWDKQVLSSTPFDYLNCSIAAIYDKLIVYWVRGKNIFYCISEDSGNTWGDTKKYIFSNNNYLYCIRLLQNPESNSEGIFTNELPGVYDQGYKLGFIDEFSYKRKEDDKGMDDFQSLMVHSLKIVSSNLEELKKSMDQLQEKVNALTQNQKQYESELGSHTLKLDMLKMELSNVKSELNNIQANVANPERNELTCQCNNEIQSKDTASGSNSTLEVTSEALYKKSLRDMPVMPGVGFKSITHDYLRNLGKT